MLNSFFSNSTLIRRVCCKFSCIVADGLNVCKNCGIQPVGVGQFAHALQTIFSSITGYAPELTIIYILINGTKSEFLISMLSQIHSRICRQLMALNSIMLLFL